MIDYAQLVDYHVHTERCGHATGSAGEYLAQAERIGLGEMAFSDHLYLYWLPEAERDPELYMPEQMLDEYVREVRDLQDGTNVRLGLALEVDYIPGWEERLREILQQHRWDYLLGSVHFLDGWGFDDPRYVDGYEKRDIDGVYERYFELIMAAAETGLFEVMAHLDLPKKFGHRAQGDQRGLHEKVVECMRQTDVCVEVSTAGLRKPVGEIYPSMALLQLCHERGVPITLSSDAHHPDEVGRDYGLALDLVREVGYTEFAVFRDRQRFFRKLP